MQSPQFSIITPSFRSSRWLQLCIASVADQSVALEHIVQDAGSDDGTLDWLPGDSRVIAHVENDCGMYDAVNRGLRRARGEIFAYINCDEQYLPGSLKKVWNFFQEHPKTQIVFADVIAVGEEGEFVCYRKVDIPTIAYTRAAVTLSTLTCATFFRRSVVEQYHLWFDSDYRTIGDADWVIRALQRRIPMGLLRDYTSVFTLTGANMNLGATAEREKAEFRQRVPRWLRAIKPILVAHHRMRRLLAGVYRQPPFDYSIYTNSNPQYRKHFRADRPTYVWPL
jgi:glycosyltransferase involved in cell wall biosynthesis